MREVSGFFFLNDEIALAADVICGNDHTLHIAVGGNVVHRVEHDRLHNGAQTARAGLPLDGKVRDRTEGVLLKNEFDPLHFKQFLILLEERVLRFTEDPHQRFFVEVVERCDDGETTDQFGD